MDSKVKASLDQVRQAIDQQHGNNVQNHEQLEELLQGDLNLQPGDELIRVISLIEGLRYFAGGEDLEGIRRRCIKILDDRVVAANGGVHRARATPAHS